MNQPIMTWNLFVTVIIVPISIVILGWWLNRLDKKREQREHLREKYREEKEKERLLLLEENRVLREKELNDWRDRYANTQCTIKNTLDKIVQSLNAKVFVSDCKIEQKDIWDAINVNREKLYTIQKEIKVIGSK